jgi:CDGSH-type Zn-finger protein/uncharacterized Fe-S cluster protein YjdI
MSIVDDFVPFDSDEKRQADKCRYPGDSLDVLYDRKRCMHAAECGKASAEVFNAKRSPWIEPNEAEKAELVRIVQRCPTGALRAVDSDGSLVADPVPPINEVTVCPDGPIYVRGRFVVDYGDDGLTAEETRVALCRCGASRNKPYCDAAHSKVRFRDAGGVHRDPDGDAPGEGVVTATVIPNGPVVLKGPMTLRAASGRPASYAAKLVLCRCGNSQNKPFCDGAHKRVGWRSVDGDGR